MNPLLKCMLHLLYPLLTTAFTVMECCPQQLLKPGIRARGEVCYSPLTLLSYLFSLPPP
uniref:Uncharacterized protein n=2 Tax=Picea TaxID=3328 RepID=A0A117NGM8_PICGL|nr:hypothetical protein ABT39_MTgene6054 [Picea glauca]QHR91437.1 hypothetical protein Q903MT_gene5471 [Picea sitchensis]